jgi:hypothetical protein
VLQTFENIVLSKMFGTERDEVFSVAVALSPRANYTDRATAACRRS